MQHSSPSTSRWLARFGSRPPSRAQTLPAPRACLPSACPALYFKGTRTYGLTFTNKAAASDSDWAVNRSTSGWVYTLVGTPIAWGSKKRDRLSLSSCEAKIIASPMAAQECLSLPARHANRYGPQTEAAYHSLHHGQHGSHRPV
eukprot:6173976-Pleurochrysis_carterae.AAC.2